MSVTVISGGTQGLGEAVARKMASAGSSGLVLGGRSRARGEALAAELSDAGTPTLFVAVDMADPDSPQALVDACERRFLTVHGVVNVAAATSRATIWTDTPDHWDRMLAINTRAPYFLIQAAARLMVRTGTAGSIVNVGSISGYGGQPKLSAYSISKGALAVMTKNLAFALMRHRIRVNQVNPGWMDTESEDVTQRTYEGATDGWLARAEAARPMGRLVKPWEVANAIAFCLSDDSGLMTGNCIDLDQSVQGAGDPPIPTAAATPQPRAGALDVVVAFNDAINARDLDALSALMSPTHRFTDSAGATVDGQAACSDAWRGFFDAFPDYRNVFDDVTEIEPGIVVARGRSECSVAALDGPATWRAVVRHGRVDEWQVSDPNAG